MNKQFVIEAVMLAVYGNLLVTKEAVEYIIPSSTISELHDYVNDSTPMMQSSADEERVRTIIKEMIQYFNMPFHRKQMERSLLAPWSAISIKYSELVQFTIVKAEDTCMWDDFFDPIETELILTAMKREAPLLTDQDEWEDRLLEYMIPIQFYDIDDFEYAMEQKSV
ncbi:ADP-heptose synthase [Brevibacillus daliensis]|uniref:ADP-heptose synthase n=1 Tax=Brevibacillus daliensis TaxID=2892995 RepID=UPI001E2E676A|nr:ADP-heptose synthase [Brevibacillus daliensis]